MLFPTDGGPPASGGIAEDGVFSLQAPAGDYKVAVIAPRPAPEIEINETNWEQAFRRVTPPPYVPGFYGDPETTPLKFVVKAEGENVCTLKIEAPKRSRR